MPWMIPPDPIAQTMGNTPSFPWNGKQAWLVCVAGLVWEIAQVHYYGKQTWLVFRINNGED